MWTLVVAVLVVLAAAQLGGGFASGVDRPHIVLILVDDMVSHLINKVFVQQKKLSRIYQSLLAYILNSGSLGYSEVKTGSL